MTEGLLGLEGMTREVLSGYLELAEALSEVLHRPIKKVPTLRGRVVANVFFEPSTRTRNSFELAAKYLSADTVNFQSSGSSVEKGETLWDTVRTLRAMQIDAVVVRHKVSGVPWQLAKMLDVPVVNAGDGIHEHPTQGLLDLLSVRQRFGPQMDGLKVAIVGDLNHSRVARSDLFGFRTMGAQVVFAGPRICWPDDAGELEVPITEDLDEALRGAQVVQVLRLQRERQAQGLIPAVPEYHARWGITEDRLGIADPEVVVLHPGPMNRGVEISSGVADGPRSLVTGQVENGVAVRMAVLYRVLGGRDVGFAS